ncbi:MAG: hypothetical protein Ct9H300mP28_27330 [Pseudomonadota bacterium]|nr:MAG: hypothetical protein Ct9H300mP28_27330 [Pseudomonadota bacterium]
MVLPVLSIVSPEIATKAFSKNAGLEHGLTTRKFLKKLFAHWNTYIGTLLIKNSKF